MKDISKADISGNLSKRRGELNMTQRELAERSHVHQSNIAGYESGRHIPSYETLRKLSIPLQTTPERIRGEEDDDIQTYKRRLIEGKKQFMADMEKAYDKLVRSVL